MIHESNSFYPLEPKRADMVRLGQEFLDRALAFIEGIADRPVLPVEAAPQGFITAMLAPPPEQPGDLTSLLDKVDKAITHAIEPGSPGFMAYVPPGGLYVSALADFYARVTNRFVGMALISPALTALEDSVLRWLAGICGLPPGAGGVLLTGGSMANFSAIIAARHDRLGERFQDGVLYMSAQTHHSVAKAARLAGFPASAVRIVAHGPDLAIDLHALSQAIAEDRQRGLTPFLVIATAGTTNTGAVDPLPELAAIAAAEDLWLHVDAAYGGMFRLTERGRQRLRGMERAHSITLDPHKGLFLPMGTGALVMRDPSRLAAANEVEGDYLHDMRSAQTFDGEYLPNFAELGPELTREMRGLRAWLPLHFHGVAAFSQQLDEKLDLAAHAHKRLSADPLLDVPWRPELSTMAFRIRPKGDSSDSIREAEGATRELLDCINGHGRALLSSTVIDGKFMIRLCILHFRTHADRVAEVLDLIAQEARRVGARLS
ncbi:pyridoxal phosphate-dependent decarboxylase family protein [Taklimakanibacter deserti]|uniref:pyridoxal phosphate-dependent decarboxylase family protein n=1 Tax=Taklimakanibacter deserti TaxID=2267839 RepID=UPI000E651FBD